MLRHVDAEGACTLECLVQASVCMCLQDICIPVGLKCEVSYLHQFLILWGESLGVGGYSIDPHVQTRQWDAEIRLQAEMPHRSPLQ